MVQCHCSLIFNGVHDILLNLCCTLAPPTTWWGLITMDGPQSSCEASYSEMSSGHIWQSYAQVIFSKISKNFTFWWLITSQNIQKLNILKVDPPLHCQNIHTRKMSVCQKWPKVLLPTHTSSTATFFWRSLFFFFPWFKYTILCKI